MQSSEDKTRLRPKLLYSWGMANSKSSWAQILTYPRQYAGVHGDNLRQTFHGFCPNSNGTFPKDTQDLSRQYTFFIPTSGFRKQPIYFLEYSNFCFFLSDSLASLKKRCRVMSILPVLNKYQSSGRTASWRPNNAQSDRSLHNPQCQSSFWRKGQ